MVKVLDPCELVEIRTIVGHADICLNTMETDSSLPLNIMCVYQCVCCIETVLIKEIMFRKQAKIGVM